MWPYWMLFAISAYFSISRLTPVERAISNHRKDMFAWVCMFLVLVLMIGLRHEVGGDWFSYITNMENGDYSSVHGDPSNNVLFWLGMNVGGGIYLVNLISAVFFTWGLLAFCRNQPRPWLALTIAIPYLVVVVAMGYTRQGVAIGLVMMAIVALSRGNILRFVLWIAFAATFHKSAIILAPLAVLANTKKRIFTIIWVGLTAFLLFVLLLREALDTLISGYISDAYESSGAAIRVAMNALPATLFLIFRKRFYLSVEERSFWSWLAVSALFLVLALIFSPSSTAVDRLALYWIPLQMFVLSRLPNVLGRRYGKNFLWVGLVVAYSLSVLLVWLYYGDHSIYWIPYQFYPWVMLWQ
jgi:hypothetical protein